MADPIHIDRREFDESFDRRAFLVDHELAGHVLFELPRLIELSKKIPETDVEYNAGNLPVDQDPYSTPRTGLSVEETIRRIENHRSWLVLKRVERDADYRQLLDACLDPLRPAVERHAGSMRRRESFIFISSPGSVTPFHMDPEHNFLLQIRGTKTVHMWDPRDRDVVLELDLERYYGGGHRNFKYREDFQRKAWTNELAPGKGLQFPVTAPHWVKNGSAVSVSYSVTFRSNVSDRRMMLYRFNHELRAKGFRPSPVGGSRFRDWSKIQLFRALTWFRKFR